MYKVVQCEEELYSIGECWQEYMKFKKASGLTERTLGNYQMVFDKLMWFKNLSEREPVTIINSKLINEWALFLLETKKPVTVNDYITIIRTFCYWLMGNGYIPPFKIKLVKHQEEVKEIYTDEEIQILSKRPKCNNFIEHRTYAIICFILSTGARAGTVCNLKKCDIDFENNEIRYTHLKNKKVAVVPLSPNLKSELLKFVKKWKIDSEYLFPNVEGNQLTVSGMRQAHNKYCKKVGVRPLSIHVLRHNFARAWIKNDGSIVKLQKILTHASIEMTNHYVQLYTDDLKKGYEKYNLLDSLRGC